MNEITQIHLGRQAFTIAVDAHAALKEYLQAIKRQVGGKGKEVVKEVEIRMAELLAEHGVSGEKVILLEDVDYLKEQLGSPKDFIDDDEETEEQQKDSEEGNNKRLFRDTDRGIIAGVAAGLAAYLHIDPVFVRIGFVLLTLFWGWGILLYILLWLIIPEAKSSSNRLQMQGKAVTVQSLKDAVHNADVPGAANRASQKAGKVLEKVGKILLVIVGIGFLLAGTAFFLAPMTTGLYLLTNGAQAFGEQIFPVGGIETWLIIAGMITAAAFSILLLLMGVAMIRRKWTLPGWAVATLIGIVLAGASIGVALGFDAAPDIAHRADKFTHTQEVKTPAFKNLDLKGQQTRFTFKPSNTYQVEVQYYGSKTAETSSVVSVSGETLTIDANKLRQDQDCRFMCFGAERWAEVTIYAPTLYAITMTDQQNTFYSEARITNDLTLNLNDQADVHMANMYPTSTSFNNSTKEQIEVKLTGMHNDIYSGSLFVSGSQMSIARTDSLHLTTSNVCLWPMPQVSLEQMPKEVKINDQPPITLQTELENRRNEEKADLYNCVDVVDYAIFY